MSTFVPRNVRINWGGEVCLGIDLCVRTEIKWILLFQGASKHFLFDSRWTGGLQQHTCRPDHLQSLTINSRLFQGYWTPSQDLFQASHINIITVKSVLMYVFVATINWKCLNTASTASVQFCRTLLDLKVTIWTLKQPHRFIYVLCSLLKRSISVLCLWGYKCRKNQMSRVQKVNIRNINLLSLPESESLVLLPQTHLESWFKLNEITIKNRFLLNNDCDENKVESLTFELRHESIERAGAEVLMDVICDEGT